MQKILVSQKNNRLVEAIIRTNDGYVSVTGNVFEPRVVRGEEKRKLANGKTVWLTSCGCLHETILERFPKLKPFVRYHLAKVDGTPMHYVANAVYFAECIAGVSQWERRSYDPDPVKAFKSTVCFDESVDTMPDLTLPASLWEHADPKKAGRTYVANVVREWCEARLPRIQAEVAKLLEELAREDFEQVYTSAA